MKKIVIISGYFNPVHIGHIDMIKGAKELGDYLVAIVNNDNQQKLKKGKIIMDEHERLAIVKEIRGIDEVFLSLDQDPTQCKTLKALAEKFKGDEVIFANGGDRDSERAIPEIDVCTNNNIKMIFGVGGNDKPNSSSSINKRLGLE